MRREERDAPDVLVRDVALEAAGRAVELEVALLQDLELELLWREHGAAAARERDALEEQHRARGAEQRRGL